MRRCCFVTMTVMFGWGIFGPESWVNVAQAQATILNTGGTFSSTLADNPRYQGSQYATDYASYFTAYGKGTFYGAKHTVTLTQGGTYTIELDGGDTFMYLFGPGNPGPFISQDDDSIKAGGGSRITYTANATGTYTIYCTTWGAVEHETYFGLNYCHFPYTLKITGPPTPQPMPPGGGGTTGIPNVNLAPPVDFFDHCLGMPCYGRIRENDAHSSTVSPRIERTPS